MFSRRIALAALASGAVSLAAPPDSVVRGRLIQQTGKPPAIETSDRRIISLKADDPTLKVLGDKRIAGMDLELKGHFAGSAQFAIDRIETHSMFAFKDGKKYRVTYYCDVCAIRSFTPGLCVCCQQETRLDLIEPAQD